MDTLEFKEYRLNDFVINKWRIDYSEDALTEMPDTDMAKDLKKQMKISGFIPFITISDAAGVCKLTYRIDSEMYHFLDSVEHNEDEITEPYFLDFISNMFLMATVVGDAKFMQDKFNIMLDYGKRLMDGNKEDGIGTATKED